MSPNPLTELAKAISDDDMESVRDRVALCPDINGRLSNATSRDYGQTILEFAVQRAYDHYSKKKRIDLSILEYLLEHGLNANREGYFALHDIILCSTVKQFRALSAELYELLKRHGADTQAKDGFGRTLLHTAAYYNPEWVVRIGAGDCRRIAFDNQLATPLGTLCKEHGRRGGTTKTFADESLRTAAQCLLELGDNPFAQHRYACNFAHGSPMEEAVKSDGELYLIAFHQAGYDVGGYLQNRGLETVEGGYIESVLPSLRRAGVMSADLASCDGAPAPQL